MKSIIELLNESISLTSKYVEDIEQLKNYKQTNMVGTIIEVIKSRISASKVKSYVNGYNRKNNTKYKLYNIDFAKNGSEFEFDPSVKNYTLVLCDCWYKDYDMKMFVAILPGQAKEKSKLESK